MTPPATTSAPMRLLSQLDGEFAIYAWQAVAVLAWEGPLTVAGVGHMDAALAALSALQSPISIVHMLRGRTDLPGAEVRAAMERLSKTHEHAIACTAILDDSQGFVAGAIKAVITGVALLARVRLEIRLFSDLDSLAAWLVAMHEKRSGVQLNLVELRGVLQTIARAHP